MIDVIAIMKQIEHMETNTPEQRQEMQKEAFRLIQEREDEARRAIEENSRLYREAHEKYMMEVQLRIQKLRASIPKRQIYFGKVKTE